MWLDVNARYSLNAGVMQTFEKIPGASNFWNHFFSVYYCFYLVFGDVCVAEAGFHH